MFTLRRLVIAISELKRVTKANAVRYLTGSSGKMGDEAGGDIVGARVVDGYFSS